jgi:hypothetical protein
MEPILSQVAGDDKCQTLDGSFLPGGRLSVFKEDA